MPAPSTLTWDDQKPFVEFILTHPELMPLVLDLEDIRHERERALLVVSEVDRLADAPDDEPMGEEGLLFDALCGELSRDPFEVDIPGVPGDLPLEEIPWTAGLYRALVAELKCADMLPVVRRRAGWRGRLYEAGAALRAETPPPLEGAVPSDPEGPAMTLAEASAALGCHPKTTERYLRSGELRAGRVGRRWRIPRSSVDSFLRRGSAKES